jgi:(p)ppGpp synthase/HD superfamily hydrolase
MNKYLEFATKAHAGQYRRDGVTEYITHCKAVAANFEETSMAYKLAILHDVLEDTKYVSSDLINAGIEEEVVWFLQLLNKKMYSSYENYIEHVSKYETTKKVKIADILHNLSDKPNEKQVKKYAKALQKLLFEKA